MARRPKLGVLVAGVLALACTAANAEFQITATWEALAYLTADPSSPPITLNGSVTFDEPVVGFGTYSFRDDGYVVTLSAEFQHGSGVGGSDSVFSLDGTRGGSGLWSGGAVYVVPEPPNAALLLAGLGLIGMTAHRRRNLAPIPIETRSV